MTPPEALALGRTDGDRDGPGWKVRVVPNLYPAFDRQEVVIHTPRHVRSFAELTAEETALVARAWHGRAEEAASSGYPYVQALLNEGREAGASLAHSHSQLVWLREPPPAAAAEAAMLSEHGCALCELLARERTDRSRVVAERDGVVMLASYAGRLPYELLIAGGHGSAQEGFDAHAFLERALDLLADGIGRLRALEGPLPLNGWLHNTGHWHFEVMPRLAVLAGLELGAGLYINTLAPEEAAERLRAAGRSAVVGPVPAP